MKLKRLTVLSIFSFTLIWPGFSLAGEETTNKNFWKPSYGSTLRQEWNNFNSYLDNLDLRLGINILAYGATIDGVTDDTTAWNSAITIADSTGSAIYMPAGISIVSSIDATQVSGITIRGEGRASIIKGTTAGKNVLDLTGSSHVIVGDLMILGDTTNEPAVGILLARESAGASAGFHKFNRIAVEGNYTVAGVYNYASETNEFNECKIDIDSGLASIILTEHNSRAITSDHCTIDTGSQSSTNQTINDCIMWNSEDETGGTNASCLEIDSWQNVRVIGNTFHTETDDKPMVWLRKTGTAYSHTISIVDNNFHATYSKGIYVDAGTAIWKLRIDQNRWGSNTNTACIVGAADQNVWDSYIQTPHLDFSASGCDFHGDNEIHIHDKAYNATSINIANYVEGRVFLRSDTTVTWGTIANVFAQIHYKNVGTISRNLRTKIGTSTSTSGLGEDDLKTITISQNSLAARSGFRFVASGSITGANGDKTIKLYFGASTLIVHPADNNTDDWVVVGTVVTRVAAGHRYAVQAWSGMTMVFNDYGEWTDDISAGDITLKLTGECGHADDIITQGLMAMEYF